jgi:hypothetical protein
MPSHCAGSFMRSMPKPGVRVHEDWDDPRLPLVGTAAQASLTRSSRPWSRSLSSSVASKKSRIWGRAPSYAESSSAFGLAEG